MCVQHAVVCAVALAAAHSALRTTGATELSSLGRSFYISPSGSDSNCGTSPDQPWLTVARANSLVLGAGDRILFQGGVDHFITTLVLSSGGTAASPVLVSSYGGGGGGGASNARLHADGSKGSALLVFNTGGVEVGNLTVIGTNPLGANQAGISLYSSATAPAGPRFSGVFIHDVVVSGFQDGITVGAATCRGFDSVTVARAEATGNWMAGMESYGPRPTTCLAHSNVVVRDSVFHGNLGKSGYTDNASGSGIVLSGVDGALVTGVEAYGNGALNAHTNGGPVGIWSYNANNVTFSRCVSHDNLNGFPSGQEDGGGFDLDGGTTNSVIEYCYSFRNAGPGFLYCQFGNERPTANNVIRYSVSVNDTLTAANGASGVSFYSPGPAITATATYGNTFINNNANPLLRPLAGPLQGALVTGNAIIALGTGPVLSFAAASQSTGLNFSGNAYWAGGGAPLSFVWNGADYSSLEAFQNGTGQEEGAGGKRTGTDADPGLATGDGFFQTCIAWRAGVYPPIPNSPMLDAVRGFSGC